MTTCRSRHENYSFHRTTTLRTIRSSARGEECSHPPSRRCLSWWLWRHGSISTCIERRCHYAFNGSQ